MRALYDLRRYFKSVALMYVIFTLLYLVLLIIAIVDVIFINSSLYNSFSEYIEHLAPYIQNTIVFSPLIFILIIMYSNITVAIFNHENDGVFNTESIVEDYYKGAADSETPKYYKSTYKFYLRSVRIILFLTILYKLSYVIFAIYTSIMNNDDIVNIFTDSNILNLNFLLDLILLLVSFKFFINSLSLRLIKAKKRDGQVLKSDMNNNTTSYDVKNSESNTEDTIYSSLETEIVKKNYNILLGVIITILVLIYIIYDSKLIFDNSALSTNLKIIEIVKANIALVLLFFAQILITAKYLYDLIFKNKKEIFYLVNKTQECNLYIFSNICIIIFLISSFSFEITAQELFIAINILVSIVTIIYNIVTKSGLTEY